MLSRRDRELPSHTTEETGFAAKAKDLGALRDAVVDAAGVGAGLWFSYLFVLFYFAIAVGAVTHRDLLLENSVKLPFLNVELPLKAFFILGPLVFLTVHAYVLLHFVLLAGKIGAFHAELQAQISGDDARARLRRQLPSNIFVQSLAGPREVRTGIIGFLLRLIAQISLVAGPLWLLVLFQLQFLPYHNEWITLWQRVAVVIDLVLLWILWPSIARGETARLGWKDFKSAKVQALLLASFLPVLLVVTIATFPGEWLEENLPPVRFIPTTWASWTPSSVQTTQTAGSGWATLHELLVAGQPNFVTGRPESLWSNVLVLPNFQVGDRVQSDAEGKISISSASVSLRGRSLEGAVLVNADLRRADFTGANLAGADLRHADLRGAKFECDPIGDWPCPQTRSDAAQLQGSRLDGAQLQGDLLGSVKLQGASFQAAQLQGASLEGAQLQGTSFDSANLRGAWLRWVEAQGTSFSGAELNGASLELSQLQGADFVLTELEGASLRGVYVWRAEAPAPANVKGALIPGHPDWSLEAPDTGAFYEGLDCRTRDDACPWRAASFSALKFVIEQQVPVGERRNWAMARIARLGQPPFAEDQYLVKAWADLEKSSPSADLYYQSLVEQLKEVGCGGDGGPQVIRGLMRNLDDRFGQSYLLQEAELAAAFLDETKCPGARGLSEENKAKLREIRARVRPPLGSNTVGR
jgi:uncharacterized protein YjbI with pentapeptide repeats